ncbi:MAG TPA: type II toxin-antitoxin system RelE/ParE family toxin [Gammaproteobacteria bacterium]|nr:type II toxin-antitoxin system RelE/ParE family toxin [Gammaproteobacteria bacterium]
MSYSLHRGAEQDLTEAFRFYRREAGNGLARRFLEEFERVMKLLEQFPDIGKLAGEDRSSFPLTGFPYSVIYRYINSEIRVLVVRHQNRDPVHGIHRF